MLTRNSRRRTAGALAALAAMGVSMVPLLSAAPAHAATAGPVDAATGIPGFFTDVTGVSLAPCFAGPPACSATKASFLTGAAPATYFSATASLPTAPPPGVPAANSTMLLAVEATAPNTAPFQRKQFQIQVPSAGTYVVTDPYGAQAFNVAAVGAPGGFDLNSTADSSALTGPIDPFLQLSAATAPAGFMS